MKIQTTFKLTVGKDSLIKARLLSLYIFEYMLNDNNNLRVTILYYMYSIHVTQR